jgi:hypothetical protein
MIAKISPPFNAFQNCRTFETDLSFVSTDASKTYAHYILRKIYVNSRKYNFLLALEYFLRNKAEQKSIRNIFYYDQ